MAKQKVANQKVPDQLYHQRHVDVLIWVQVMFWMLPEPVGAVLAIQLQQRKTILYFTVP